MQRLIREHSWRISGLGALLALCTVSSAARGQPVTAYPIEGKALKGALVSFAIPGDVVLEHGGEKSTISWNDLDRLALNVRGEAVTEAWRLALADGGVLFGRIAGGSETAVRVEHAILGALTIPFEQVQVIERRSAAGEAGDGSRASGSRDRVEDRLILINGDVLKGSIARLTSEGVAIVSGERERLVAWGAIRRVILAPMPSSAGPGMAGATSRDANETKAQFQLVDGSTLAARGATLRGASIQVDSGLGFVLAMPPDAIRTIESVGGRRAWLSDMPASDSREVRYFDHSIPSDMAAFGRAEPIRLDGAAHGRGLRFAGAGKRSWKLQGQFVLLRASLGMEDGTGPLADADVVIRVDGRPVIEHRGLRSGQPARSVEINLSGANELEIDVGFGRRGPVQDCVVLVNPALLKRP